MKRVGFILSLSSCAFIHQTTAMSKSAEINAIKSEIAKLLARVDELEKDEAPLKKPFKKQAVHHKTAETKAPQKEPILDKIAHSGNDKVKLSVSGHLNRAAALYSDGKKTQVKHVDVIASPSRLNLTGTAKLHENFTAGATLEASFISDGSEDMDVKQPTTPSSQVTFRERKAEVFFDTKWGKLSLGQGESAAHRVTNLDLTGTNVVQEGAEFESPGGGLVFLKKNATTGKYVKDRAFVNVFSEILSSKRIDRVRYDTPQFFGFTASVAHATKNIVDTALRFSGKLNDHEIAAAAGFINVPYSTVTGRKGNHQWGGSAFILTPQGFSFGGGAALKHYRDKFRKDGHMFSVKGGYQHSFFDFGKTCFALGAGFGSRLFDNTPVAGSPTALTFAEDNNERTRVYGLYLVQNIDDAATEVYLGAQRQELKRKQLVATNLVKSRAKPQTAVLAGARVKF